MKHNEIAKMRKVKYLMSIVKEKIRGFTKVCTLHGFSYMSGHHWLVRVTWGTVLFASFLLGAYLSEMIMKKFIVNPTLTVIASTHYSTTNIRFPAVYVCNDEQVYVPATDNVTEILQHRGYTKYQIYSFYKSFVTVKKERYEPDATVKKMHNMLTDKGFTYNKLLDLFKIPCDLIIKRCIWRSREHNCTEMFREMYTFAGYCCVFDIEYFRLNAPSDTIFTAGIGENDALDVTLDGSKFSSKGNSIEGSLTMFIIDPTVNLTLVHNPLSISPAQFYDVNIFLFEMESSDEVKSLPMKSRKCLSNTESVAGADNFSGCLSNLVLREVVEHCKCIPFRYTPQELQVESHSSCSWDRLPCVYKTIREFQGSNNDQDSCLQRCDYTQYTTQTEHVRSLTRLRTMKSNASIALIHFSAYTCIQYRREVLYTWDQMLANLGGIFGLCLGGSIISIIEIIWFLLDLLRTVIIFSFKQRNIQPASTNKIYVINKKMLHKKKNIDDRKIRFIN